MGPAARFELETDAGEEVPGDIFVLLNDGSTQKMSRVVAKHVSTITDPEGGAAQPQRIQVFRRIASGVICSSDATDSILHPTDAALGDLRLRIVCDGQGESKNASGRSQALQQDKEQSPRIKPASSIITGYLEKHRLQEVLADGMRRVLQHQPDDPFELLISALQNARDEAGITSPSQGQPVQGIAFAVATPCSAAESPQSSAPEPVLSCSNSSSTAEAPQSLAPEPVLPCSNSSKEEVLAPEPPMAGTIPVSTAATEENSEVDPSPSMVSPPWDFTSCPLVLGCVGVIGDTTYRPCLSKVLQKESSRSLGKDGQVGSGSGECAVGVTSDSTPCLSKLLQNRTPGSFAAGSVGKGYGMSVPAVMGDTSSRPCLSKVLLNRARQSRTEPHVGLPTPEIRKEAAVNHDITQLRTRTRALLKDGYKSGQLGQLLNKPRVDVTASASIHLKARTLFAEAYRSGRLEQMLKMTHLSESSPGISDKFLSQKLLEESNSTKVLKNIHRASFLPTLEVEPSKEPLTKIIEASLEGEHSRVPRARSASLRASPRRRQQVSCMRRLQSVPGGGRVVQRQTERCHHELGDPVV